MSNLVSRILYVSLFLFLSACSTVASPEPSISSEIVRFPVQLVESVTLPQGEALEKRQLAYCQKVIQENESYLYPNRWKVIVTTVDNKQQHYVDLVYPQATTSDMGCLGFSPNSMGFSVSDLAWSPNGTQLIYGLDNAVLALADISSDGQTINVSPFLNPPQYTFYPHNRAPVWSPDGIYVAFISEFEEGVMEIGQKMFSSSVFIAEASGENPQYFVQEDRLPGIFSRPSWSRDGTRLAYSPQVPANGLNIIDLTSNEVTQLNAQTVSVIPEGTIEAHGLLPYDIIAWLPGDKLILFLTNSGSEEDDILWLMEPDGSNPIEIYRGSIQQIQLSPDGKMLALVLIEGLGRYKITVLSLAVTITQEDILQKNKWAYAGQRGVAITDLEWSPDGRFLAFAANPEENFDLFAWDVMEQQIVQLTNTPDFDELAPRWRPVYP